MSNPVESLGYIKNHSSSSPRTIKNPTNSVRYNCQKICSRLSQAPVPPYVFLGDQEAYYLQVFQR